MAEYVLMSGFEKKNKERGESFSFFLLLEENYKRKKDSKSNGHFNVAIWMAGKEP
jgi:hypothetical protein